MWGLTEHITREAKNGELSVGILPHQAPVVVRLCGALVLEPESLICFYTQAFNTLYLQQIPLPYLWIKGHNINLLRFFWGFSECAGTFERVLCKYKVVFFPYDRINPQNFIHWSFLFFVPFPSFSRKPSCSPSEVFFSRCHVLQVLCLQIWKPLEIIYSKLLHLQVRKQRSRQWVSQCL